MFVVRAATTKKQEINRYLLPKQNVIFKFYQGGFQDCLSANECPCEKGLFLALVFLSQNGMGENKQNCYREAGQLN